MNNLTNRAVLFYKKKQKVLALEEEIKDELRKKYLRSFKLVSANVGEKDSCVKTKIVLVPMYKVPKDYKKTEEYIYLKGERQIVHEYTLQHKDGITLSFYFLESIQKDILNEKESRFYMQGTDIVNSIEYCRVTIEDAVYEITDLKYNKKILEEKIFSEFADVELEFASKINDSYEVAQKELDNILHSFKKINFDLRNVRDKTQIELSKKLIAEIELVQANTSYFFNAIYKNKDFVLNIGRLYCISWKYKVSIGSKDGSFLCDTKICYKTWKDEVKEKIKIFEVKDMIKKYS